MSKICKIFLVILLLAACSKKDNREELTIVDNEGNTITYKVELAQTPDELRTGLMNRKSLDTNSGMIFDLSQFEKTQTAMWMKDTNLTLDMIFIDDSGMVFWVYENAEPNSAKLIVAPYAAAAVLEVNGGDISAKGIKIGDTVKYKLFSENVEPVVTNAEPENVVEEVSVTEVEVVPAEAVNETALETKAPVEAEAKTDAVPAPTENK